MPPSNAQKKASNKYNSIHMATIGCKLKKSQAMTFKAYCTERNTTPNAELKRYILECIGEADIEKDLSENE